MKKYNFIFLIMLISLYSFGQSVKSLDFKLIVYPSSGGEYGYVIEIQDSLFRVMSKKLIIENGKIVLGEVLNTKEKVISNRQIKSLKKHIYDLENLKEEYKIIQNPLDVWVFDLFINGKQYLVVNSSVIKNAELEKVEKVIRYLKKISPLKIILRQFS